MKKLFTLVAFVTLLGTGAFAQSSSVGNSPAFEAKVTEITRTMTQKLRLNEPEYIKLKALNRERMMATEQLLQSQTTNAGELSEKLAALEQAYEHRLTSFLTAKQQEAYAAYKAEPTEARFVSSTNK